MKLSFVYPETLPSKKARAISVTNTARALAHYCDVTLYCEEGSDCPELSRDSSLRCVPVSKKKAFLRSNKIFNANLIKADGFLDTQIIYLRHLKAAASLLRKRPESSKIIFECHEIFFHSNPKIEKLERYVIENADGLVFVNESLKKIFNEIFKITHIPQKVINNGCGFALDYIEKDYTQLNTMLYIGSFQPWKGVDFLIESMAHLPRMSLEIIGYGEQIELLQQRAKELNASERINFLGYKNQNEIIEFLKKETICIIPNTLSTQTLFSTPIKLYEYMASSNLVLASNTPTIKEIIDNGKNGFLFETGNLEHFVETVEQIQKTDSDRLNKIAKQTYEDSKNYTWDARAEKICDFAKHIMNRQSNPGQ